MYKQFEKLRRMPEKRMESIFATEMCVLGDSKMTIHVREPSFAFFSL